jgi:hypothetical protein
VRGGEPRGERQRTMKFLTYWRAGRGMGFGRFYLVWWWLFRR